jgi:hypothetical protein
VREAVITGFDDLPTHFATTDFLFGNYVEDSNIVRASVAFVLAVFKAVEEAVLFYTSKQGASFDRVR